MMIPPIRSMEYSSHVGKGRLNDARDRIAHRIHVPLIAPPHYSRLKASEARGEIHNQKTGRSLYRNSIMLYQRDEREASHYHRTNGGDQRIHH